MNNINLRIVSDADTILNAVNELPTQSEEWVDANEEWSKDNDEEDFIISDGECRNQRPIIWMVLWLRQESEADMA